MLPGIFAIPFSRMAIGCMDSSLTNRNRAVILILYCSFDAISRAEFTQEVYSHIYQDSSFTSSIGSDRLSLLFIVLALGTLLDITKPYDIRSSEPYYQLAKAAFVVESLIEAATIPTMQSLVRQVVS